MKKRRPRRTKWHKVSSTAAKHLAEQVSKPGLHHPVMPYALPSQLKNIPGALDFYVSSYSTPVPLPQGVTAGGEIAVRREGAGIGKVDNYIYGTSSNSVVFAGPDKSIPSHHFATSSPFPIEGFFGNSLTKGKT